MVARGLKEASLNGPAEHARRLLNKHRPILRPVSSSKQKRSIRCFCHDWLTALAGGAFRGQGLKVTRRIFPEGPKSHRFFV